MPSAAATGGTCRRRLAGGLLLAVMVALMACGQGPNGAGAKSEEDDPARLVRVEGSDVKAITLAARAADRLGIKTESVREVPAPGGTTPLKVVPVSALIYDKNGEVWVYTATPPRSYVRQQVSVTRIDGNVAVLGSGPAPGTAVVTVGAPELLGTELGVGGA
jgi:hypothetical protein